MNQKKIPFCGVTAALYAVLTLLLAPYSFGPLQLRLSEAMCVLCLFTPSAAIGLSLGCAVSNLFSTVSALDLVLGTAGTLLGCMTASRVKNKWLFPLPVGVANGALVGAEMALVYTPDALLSGFLIYGGQILLSELLVIYALGLPLYRALEKTGVGEKLRSLNGAKTGS